MSELKVIELEGVRVHNLRDINLKIRHQSMTVICGVSGSGKSSLAFDTLFAEGQRRYIETFSPSARQFLDRIERPAVDRITGLPPAIAIRQQLRADGPRSTLGTRTEIIDSLRVLFARIGTTVCPTCKTHVRPQNPESAADEILQTCVGRIMITAEIPLEADTARSVLDRLLRNGFTRAIAGNDSVRIEQLNESALPASLLVVVDRLKCDSSIRARLAETIATAMTLGEGHCKVLAEGLAEPLADDTESAGIQKYGQMKNKPVDGIPDRQGSAGKLPSLNVDNVPWLLLPFSSRRSCESCGRIFPEPSPEQMSFTSPLGACQTCEGTGVARQLTTPRQKSRGHTQQLRTCESCCGCRLSSEAVSIQVSGNTIVEVCAMECADLTRWLSNVFETLPTTMQSAVRPAFEHVGRRLRILLDLGLGYLSLDRAMNTLSGGESQRAALTTALGSGLINTLYVLDEPTAGLHQNDTDKVVQKIRALQEQGNTIVVVEHDPVVVMAADEVIEIGPGAGENGGRVVFQGSPAELLKAETITGQRFREWVLRSQVRAEKQGDQSPSPADSPPHKPASQRKTAKKKTASLSGSSTEMNTEQVPATQSAVSSEFQSDTPRRQPEQWLELRGVNCHNIKDQDVRIPLGVFCGITGPSGSGKSSLIADTLYPALRAALKLPLDLTVNTQQDGTVVSMRGADQIESVMLLDQRAIQRSRRSIPATWIGVFDEIRVLLAETHEARKRNYSRAMFSFNAASGGRCPICEGRGIVTVAMQFLADIETPCEECSGQRFRREVLEVRYRDRSVDDILRMTADDAFVFFNGHHKIQQRLSAMRQAGLGYIRLGQPLSTISGGEAQRLRIAALLAGLPLMDGDVAAENRKTPGLTRSGRTLFLLDEPACGLHLQDLDHLLGCIDFLIQTGHSVVVVDHDEWLISRADWLIELGPSAGRAGGKIVRSGPQRS